MEFTEHGYRWLQPMNYIEMPKRLIEQAEPIQAQMLGKISHNTGFYLPKEEDIPLKKWVEQRKAVLHDPRNGPSQVSYGKM